MVTPKILFFIFIAIAVIFEIVADIFLKKWSIESKNMMLVIGLILYFIGTIFWAYSLRYELLSKSIVIFTIINLIVISLVGVIFFKENLSIANKIGILTGILTVFLLER